MENPFSGVSKRGTVITEIGGKSDNAACGYEQGRFDSGKSVEIESGCREQRLEGRGEEKIFCTEPIL